MCRMPAVRRGQPAVSASHPQGAPEHCQRLRGAQVAIRYSGLAAGKALPIVLEVRTGAVDRGACVRDFSQYVDEVEYLWVPGSFLEQVARPPAHYCCPPSLREACGYLRPREKVSRFWSA